MQKRILCYAVALLFSSFLPSQEVTAVYSADKPIWDLRNFSDATDMSAQDDGTSQVFNLGFDFDFFGQTFDKAYMASNGCLILGQLATGNNWEKNCTQYEPSEAPNTNYTMYPFWTDLIMGGNSSMLAMQIDNKVIFGWYEMWEYYRDSKNTFELWLYPNNSYEARYSELDIKDHDVFIGIQGNENERETYYFHDKCFTGQVNSKECVSQDWNDTTINFDLENNGSILVGEALDCSHLMILAVLVMLLLTKLNNVILTNYTMNYVRITQMPMTINNAIKTHSMLLFAQAIINKTLWLTSMKNKWTMGLTKKICGMTKNTMNG
jgi:hypothetical protein